MSDIAIRVETLSKQYRIGEREAYQTLRDVLSGAALKHIKRLRSSLDGSVFGKSEAEKNRTIWALKDVSFEVKQGEVVGVIGRNGAGKSTLLKILSRITRPTSGYAEIHGRVGSLLEVGTGFHPELTGRENIYLNGAILGMRREEIQRRFDEIVAFAEIEKFLDTPVKRYSSGMYIRLAFAVAAHLELEILLVDEVLAVGDAVFQKKCLGKMGDVAKEGRTILFVSHNMSSIQHLCSSAIILQEGHIDYYGGVEESINRYLTSENSGSEAILSYIKYNNPQITISNLTINGSAEDNIYLPFNCKSIDIEISGILVEPMRLLLEARIFDLYERCLAFFTPRRDREDFNLLPSGRFTLSESISLPMLNHGDYFLRLGIVEADNNAIPPANFEKAILLIAEGTPTVTGWVYKYARGNGWMLLSSNDNKQDS